MNPDFDTALDDCLTRLQAGVELDECLSRYPAHAAALRPLLDLAAAVQDLPAPQARPAAVQANRDRMMAVVARQQAQPSAAASLLVPKPLLSRYTERISTALTGKEKEGKDMGFIVRFATAVIAAVMALGTLSMGTAALASANSLPGDALYPVKLAVENVQLSLTLDEAARQRFQVELEARRRNEVQAVVRERRQVEVQFWGTLTAFDACQWVVDGIAVLVDAQTQIKGEPTKGDRVHVLAVTQADGSILARQVVMPGGTSRGPGPQGSPGPHGTGTPQPQGTPQQNRHQESTGTPEPKGTQEQQRNRQQATGTPQPSPNPPGTQEQQRNREQSHGTPETTHTPDPTGSPGQQHNHGTPQATPKPTNAQNQGKGGQ